jgi:hypothetical protein
LRTNTVCTSQALKFQGKYVVSAIDKYVLIFHAQWQHLTPDTQEISGFTQFIHIHFYNSKHHTVFKSAACVYCSILLSNQSYGAVVQAQAYQLNFPGASVLDTSALLDLNINRAIFRGVSTKMLKRAELCLQKGWR